MNALILKFQNPAISIYGMNLGFVLNVMLPNKHTQTFVNFGLDNVFWIIVFKSIKFDSD